MELNPNEVAVVVDDAPESEMGPEKGAAERSLDEECASINSQQSNLPTLSTKPGSRISHTTPLLSDDEADQSARSFA